MAEEVIKIVGTADMSSLNKGLDTSKGKLDSFGKSVQNTQKDLKAAVPGTNQASQALTNLGRVAQDAPFGFIGIANNLNPLLESFQRLQTTTGSAGGALKALGSSLLGPAGIGIALSVVSSLFLAFGSQIVDFINKTSAAEKTQRELNKTLAEAEASVAGNVSRLQALASIAQDVSRTDAVRKEAIGALNKEYDVFNGKLDINNVNTAENISLVNKQSAALVTNAKIIGLQNLIAKTTEEKYKILNSTLTDNLSILETLKLGALSALSPVKGLTDANTVALKNQAKAIGDNANKVKFFEDELKKLLGTQAAAGDLFKEKPIKELKLKAKKVKVEATGEVSLGEETLKKQIKFGPEQKVSLAVDVEVAPKINKKGGIAQIIQDEIERARLAAEQKIIEFNNFVAQSTEAIIEGSLFNLGEAIGNALTGKGDGLTGLFDSIFQSVGSQIQQLGKFLIETGVKIAAAKKAFAKLLANPLASIAVGVGLVALGSLLKSVIGKKPQGFATGTRNFSGGTAIVGERGPELIGLPRGASVTPNAQSNAILNGASAGGFVASYVLRGQDLITVINRTTQSNNRAGFNS